MSRVKFKPITIRDAELEDDSRLFVLNRTNPVANINMNITTETGERTVITIPISPCPVDMSIFCEKGSILRSPVFRRLVAGAHIALINTEQAADFVTNDPRGIRETAKIFKANHEGLEFLGEEVETTFVQDTGATPAEKVGAGSSNMFIENIVLRSKSGQEDAQDLISELEARIDSLTLADMEYLSNYAASQDIKTWAAEARSLFDEPAE